MTVLTTRAVAATVDTLIGDVRRMVGDTDSDTNNQRWLDADIMREIDHQLVSMYVEVSSQDPSGYVQAVIFPYGANTESMELPDEINGSSIYKVEDFSNTSAPIYYPYRSLLNFNRFTDEFGWTLIGNSIALSPKPTSAKTLRIYSLAPFVPVSGSADTDTDQHALSINHEELICLGAAIRLQEVDNQVSQARLSRYQQLWEQYQKTAARRIGPVYVRSTRILI